MAFDGTIITRLREQYGYTRKYLVDKCGLSYSYMSQIEESRGNPTYSALESIAHVFNLDVLDLLTRDKTVKRNDDCDGKLLECLIEHVHENMDDDARASYTFYKTRAKLKPIIEVHIDDIVVKADSDLREAILLLIGLKHSND